MRTAIAAALSTVLLVALPLAGGVGGAYYTVEFLTPAPKPEAETKPEDKKLSCGLGPFIAGVFTSFATAVAAFGGLAVGVAIGVAAALPVVNVISEWSVDESTTDEEDE
jgi:hypothetical protein